MQRCKLVMDQVTEARDTMMKVLDHKDKVLKLLNKNGVVKKSSKLKRKERAWARLRPPSPPPQPGRRSCCELWCYDLLHTITRTLLNCLRLDREKPQERSHQKLNHVFSFSLRTRGHFYPPSFFLLFSDCLKMHLWRRRCKKSDSDYLVLMWTTWEMQSLGICFFCL